jgi:hypothetical protein
MTFALGSKSAWSRYWYALRIGLYMIKLEGLLVEVLQCFRSEFFLLLSSYWCVSTIFSA